MTRNTKLYKATFGTREIIYRDLNVLELTFLNNMSNICYKYEFAIKTAKVDGELSDLTWPVIQQLGQQVIDNSTRLISDSELLELIAKDMRIKVKEDFLLGLILKILTNLPGMTFEHLLTLTPKDLIELICLCEVSTNKHIFNFKGTPGPKITGSKPKEKTYFQDDGISLQEKMKENMKYYGAS